MIVKKEGQVTFATGSPGGSTIITSVMQLALNVMEWNMNISEATHRPRIHHQWLPDAVYSEPSISRDTLGALEALGHKLTKNADGSFERTILGRVNSVGQWGDFTVGAADPRGPKSAAIGE